MAASVNRLAGALCFNNGDNAEERLREFLAVSKLVLQVTHYNPSALPAGATLKPS